MLVNLKDLLKKAYKKKLAIGAFNAYNLETIRGIIKAAEGLNAPVIVETTPKAIEYAGLKYLSTLIKEMADDVEIPVVLHLDHGLSIEMVEQSIEAGYTSVMIDGSHLPLFENIALTKKVVEIARKKGIPVEGELGTVTEHLRFTNPEEVPEFVRKTGVDSLAVAIGSSHGHAPKEELDLELLFKIRRRTDIPLVLHGASGVSDSDIKGAIQRGIAKINIDTNLREVFTASIRENIKDPQIIDPRQYLKAAEDAIAKLVEEKILLFGSMNV
jgi:fructose-bisphosphate aldolase class II